MADWLDGTGRNLLGQRLRSCRGFKVVARDGQVGTVDHVLLPPDRLEPDYLVVRARGRFRRRFPVVAAAVVRAVDTRGGIVHVTGEASEIVGLSEELPLAI